MGESHEVMQASVLQTTSGIRVSSGSTRSSRTSTRRSSSGGCSMSAWRPCDCMPNARIGFRHALVTSTAVVGRVWPGGTRSSM
eukprot:3873245-Alexandrium_andersonii.AAC.1